MGSTVQVNARMSRQLRNEGDAALARIGLSPTQAIRALWEKASRLGERSRASRTAAGSTYPSAAGRAGAGRIVAAGVRHDGRGLSPTRA